MSLGRWHAAGMLLAGAALFAAGPAPSARAQTPPAVGTAAPDEQIEMVDGEVRKVDADGMKLSVRHAEIKSLDMPSMTMVFRVADKAMTDGLQPGDKVRIGVRKTGSNYTIVKLQRVN